MTEQKKISLRVLDGQTEIAEDELVRLGDFLNTISKPLFYIALVAAGLFFGNRFYQDAQDKKFKSGAEQLQIVQESFEELSKAITATATAANPEDKVKKEKTVSDLENRFSEQLKTLEDRTEPYRGYAESYRKLVAAVKGDDAAAAAVQKSVIDSLAR